MIDFFSNIELDKQSFWLGFIAGAVFLWFVLRLRIYLPRFISFIKQTYQVTREGLTSGAELRYRNEILNHMQKLHISSQMFSLDEIIIPPRMMVQTTNSVMDNELDSEDIISLTIPYLPDWPELSAQYNAPTLPITDALANGVNIVLIGHPGSGKTVSLAYLASLLLRGDVKTSGLENLLPFYVHAQEINPESDDPSHLDSIIKAISKNLSTLTQQRFPTLIHTLFENGRALLLIDGLDEISPRKFIQVKGYIQQLLDNYPGLRLVVATSPSGFRGLPQMGMIPVFLAAWSEDMINKFLDNFGQMWTRFIVQGDNAKEDEFTNILIKSWLESHDFPQSPLELTLRVWSAYAGDLIGADYTANLEAYIRRTTTDFTGVREILEQLASQMILEEAFILDINNILADDIITSEMVNPGVSMTSESEEIEPMPDKFESIPDDVESEKVEPSVALNIRAIFNELKQRGLLFSTDDRNYRFSHSEIACYLSGSYLSKTEYITKLLEQGDWTGKSQTIGYYLYFSQDGENIIKPYLDEEDLLQRQPLHVARWLKIINSQSSWYEYFLRFLASKLQYESLSLGLSGRFLTALALSRDSNIKALFRKLLSSEQANIRQLSALGCGLIKDMKSIPELTRLINDPIPGVSRAACLALVAIGNKNALETVATALLQGSEMVRRYAAESLANHPEEGHPALRDGSKMEDLLVRRAVVFGLARVNQKWALDILEQMQLEDQQWLVRNAAIQALEDLTQDKTNIPKPSLPLTDTPWLIEFASKLGIGVAPGKPAIDLLIRALNDGDEALRLAALDYLRMNGIEEVIPTVLNVYHSSLGDVREAALNTLWHMSASGLEINLRTSQQGYLKNSSTPDTINTQ